MILPRWCAFLCGVVVSTTSYGMVVRAEGETLTSAACPSLRWAAYPARLDLLYFYLIEFPNTTTPDLKGIERAIAVGLIDTFQGCNAYGEPVHAVKLSERGHRYYTPGGDSGICTASTPGDECRVVRGLTSILLDTSSNGVADAAYSAIMDILASGMVQFLDTPLHRAEFIRRIGENLVFQPVDDDDDDDFRDDGIESGHSPGTFTWIAVISAVTAFVLATIVFAGILRAREKGRNETANMRLAYYNAKRRKFWSQLEEDEDNHTYPGLMMTEPPQMHTVTWSVSDLTSESASIKSALKMDRIDEEYEGQSNESHAGESDEEQADPDVSYEEAKVEEGEEDLGASPLPRPSLENLPFPFIAHWRDDQSELATRGSQTPILPDRVWELAAMPHSYWDESDPEAPTPGNSPSITRGSPHGCAYLQDTTYDDEESFAADHELDFSTDKECSPHKGSPDKRVPVMTYTTEEEDFSFASSGTQRQVLMEEGSPRLTVPREADADMTSSEEASTGEWTDTTSSRKDDKSTSSWQATEPSLLMKQDLIDSPQHQEQKKSCSPDPILKANTAVTEQEDYGSHDSSRDTSDQESSVVSSTHADVFCTPPLKGGVEQSDSLTTVAHTIVTDAHMYDEATQRWARRVLAEMASPSTPLLLADTPYPHSC